MASGGYPSPFWHEVPILDLLLFKQQISGRSPFFLFVEFCVYFLLFLIFGSIRAKNKWPKLTVKKISGEQKYFFEKI